jgi:hypothetical protein
MSDKSIAERLQVKNGRTLAVIAAPDAINDLIGAKDQRSPPKQADVVLQFFTDQAQLTAKLPATATNVRQDAILWAAYAKKTSPLAKDLSRDVIHMLAPTFGLDTVAQIAIDADWSALRLKRLT